MTPVQEYLLYLLNYFYWFFETMNNASPEPNRQMHVYSIDSYERTLSLYLFLSSSDRSEREKDRIRRSYAYLLASLHELDCKYARLLLGIDLKDFHHMRNGE